MSAASVGSALHAGLGVVAVLALVADGRHVLSDFYTSAGIVVGLLLVYATGISWLDPVVAAVDGLGQGSGGRYGVGAAGAERLAAGADPDGRGAGRGAGTPVDVCRRRAMSPRR